MPTTRTFRVFVSSTFSDLKAERNALQEKVFPRLRDLAAAHGCRFQAIDLRWGVSDEASLDQQAMNICLGEIARCQQTSPRPNFIVLLGDRYGWCPPPSQIPDSEFNEIRSAIKSEEDKALLADWYVLDENAVPPEWRLKSRQKGSEYENYDNWQPVETQLHKLLAEAVKKLNWTADQQLPYVASATEQEIAAGALQVKDAPEHVICFFRSIDALPLKFRTHDFLSMLEGELKQEYPDGLSQLCKDLIKPILELSASSSAKDCAEQIQQIIKHAPKSTPEAEVLNFIRQALVDYTARDYFNLVENEWVIDEEASNQQKELKARLNGYQVFPYEACWTGNGITNEHIGTLPENLAKCLPLLKDSYVPKTLCEAVWCSLGRIIQQEISQPHPIIPWEKVVIHIQPDPGLDAEGLAHHKFAEDRLRFFVGRSETLANIANYLRNNQRRNLTIVGAGGTGKSALLARATQQTQELHPKAEIVYRFIGVTPGSSDGRSLLDSLCHELSRRYQADEATIPTNYRDLVPELRKRMQLASADQPLILFLDSLDQLSASQNARNLIWLPDELPENVSVIVSTREEDTFKAMQAKQACEERLRGLSCKEGEDLLSQWLKSIKRTLQEAQLKEVLDKFNQSEGNPLYLKLAFEEARLWTSDSGQPPESLAPGVKGIIEKNMIDRLKKEASHGKALVSHALGYLAASRYGLAEDEMLDLLSRDLQVYEWFFLRSFHVPADLLRWAIHYRGQTITGELKGNANSGEAEAALAWLKEIRRQTDQTSKFLSTILPKADGPRLPVVLWSRLSFDLAPYLTERMVDGSPLLNFYHRELGEVAFTAFLSQSKDLPYHERLADYFRSKADPAGDHTWNGHSLHGLSELPYHLTKAERFDDVYQTLIDFKFLEHKAAEVGVLERQGEKGKTTKTYTGVLQLQEDYERALAAMPGSDGAYDDRAPLILTAIETSKGLMVYCPVCNKYSPIKKDMLDTVILCPQEPCQAPIKLNPFTIKREI